MSDEAPEQTDTTSRAGLLERLSDRRTLTMLGLLSVVLLFAAAIGMQYYRQHRSKTTFQPVTPPSMEELAEQFPEIANILQDDKLDSVYKQFLIAYQEGGPEAAYELAKKRGILNDRNEVRLTLELDTTDTAELRSGLEAAGIKVTAEGGNLMDIAIPVEVLEASMKSDEPGQVFMHISGLEHIVRLRIPEYGIGDLLGEVETEGVAVIGANAWQAAGYTGKGVRIGVLDMGFDKYRGLLGTDLPVNVLARSFRAGQEIDQTGTEHGTAVAEIIYDIAPDAELIFAAYQTGAEKLQAVDWLMSQDIDILSTSTASIVGPIDGTSPYAKQVDEVTAQGVLWINSTGNSALSHYRGKFTDMDGDSYHEFSGDDEIMGFIPAGPAAIALNWDDWEKGIQDFDLFIFDKDSNLIAASTNVQGGPQSGAVEFIYYEFPDEGPYYFVIQRKWSDREVIFDLVMRDGLFEYYNPEYSLQVPSDAFTSLSVGATKWQNDQLEDYSSQGPTHDGRIKPELSAPTGVNSVAYEGTWVGTSASCPHVSGAAALILQAFPDYTPDQVKEFLISRAVDLGENGPDNQTGYGRLWLGDPPGGTGAVPIPTPSEPTEAPEPTEVVIKGPSETARPTSTPKFEKKSIGSGGTDPTSLLILLGCVGLPGLLGLGGISILGVVFLSARSRGAQRPPIPTAYPEAGWESGAAPALQPPAPGPEARCPNCGNPYKAGTKFCSKCGHQLKTEPQAAAPAPQYCSNCGHALRPNSRFCPNCGQKVP